MNFNSKQLHPRWVRLRPYLGAALGLAVATLVRSALDPLLGDRQAYMTYMAALIGTAWLGGVGPALFVLVGSLPLAMFLFMSPRYSLMVVDAYNYIAIVTYLALGIPIVALGGKFWRARHEAKQTEEVYGTQARELAAERKRLQQELGRLSEELRDVDRRREDFLGLLADELRRPLIPIASAASFHSIAATASEMASAMDVVKQETSQLGRVLDDLLDVFRSSQAGILLQKKKVDLVEIANRAAAGVRSMAAQSGRELNISVAKAPVWIDGDAARVERVVYNLLNNAIRSTDPGGQIWLTVNERDGAALLRIKDTGAGLSAEALDRLFQPTSSLDSGGQGHGNIGMSAIKPIVELHGGMVTAHSEGVGHGCEFIVRLPLVDRALPPTTGDRVQQTAPEEQASRPSSHEA